MLALSKILFPVDFSERCQGAARYVEAIAGRFKAEVHLMHVVEPLPEPAGIPVTEWVAARRERLEGLFREEFAYLRVVHATPLGDPAYHIVEYAKQNGIGLIMMPTHGWGPYRRFLLGSVTAKVLHDASCPVWTGVHLEEAPPLDKIGFRNIVAAVDLGARTGAVLRWTKAFAEEYDAKAVAAHAVPAFRAQGELYVEGDLSAALLEQARREMDRAQSEAGVAWPTEISGGDPAHTLAAAAKNFNADLLVIGRSEMQGLGRLRASGYSIVRNAPCPVVSV